MNDMMKIVEVSDSGYTEGLREGKLARETIVDEIRISSLERMREEAIRSFSASPSLRYRIDNINKWNETKLNETYFLFHRLVLESFPGTTAYPELKGAVEWWRDWVKGIATGANITESAVFRYRYWRVLKPYFYEFEPSEMECWLNAGGKLPIENAHGRGVSSDCTAIALVDTTEGRLIGKSCDDAFVWTKSQSFKDNRPTLMLNRSGGYNYVVAIGYVVNEAGLAACSAGGAKYAESPPVVRFPIPGGIDRIVMSYASSTKEAVDIYRRYCGLLEDNSNVVIIDKPGSAVVLEPVRVELAERWCERGIAYTTSKGLSDLKLRKKVINTPQELAYYDERMGRLRWHLEERQGPLCYQRLRDAQCDHNGWAHLCQHQDRLPAKEIQPNGEAWQMISFVTIKHIIGELDRQRYTCYTYDNGKYPCQVEPQWFNYRFRP